MPVPKKKRHRKCRMRMGPEGIEIHVDRQRTGPPNRKRGERGPALLNVMTSDAKRQKQTQETKTRRGKRHADAIGQGKAVRGNGRAEGVREKHTSMRQEQKWRPEDGWSNAEVIFQASRGGTEEGQGFAGFVHMPFTETGVSVLVV